MRDFYVVRTDAIGDTLWTRTYGGTDVDGAHAVHQTSDHGYILVGQTASYGAGGYDAWLIKTDSLGDTLWTRVFGGEESDVANSVRRTSDGGYIIAGETRSFGAGESDVWLVRTDANGDTLWTRTYGGDDMDVATCVSGTTDGGYIVCGTSASLTGIEGDAYLIKTDSLGKAGVSEQSPSPLATGPEPATTVVGSLPRGAVAFDAMGRRVLHPKPGVHFLRTAAAAPRKVLLVE